MKKSSLPSENPCQKISESLYQQIPLADIRESSLAERLSRHSAENAGEWAEPWLRGGRLFRCRSLGSTNTEMRKCLQKEAFFHHADVLMADMQVSGRGRKAKSWKSFAGKSLAVSILLDLNRSADVKRRDSSTNQLMPSLDTGENILFPQSVFLQSIVLSQLAALAIVWLAADCAVPCYLKWPNDVHVLQNFDTKNEKSLALLKKLLDTSSFLEAQAQMQPQMQPQSLFLADSLQDLGLSSLKLAGLLSESLSLAARPQKFIILGIGMNVSLHEKDLGQILADTGHASSSLSREMRNNENKSLKNRWLADFKAAIKKAGTCQNAYNFAIQSHQPSPYSLIWPILERFSYLHRRIQEQGLGLFAALWKQHSFMIGRVIRFSFSENPVEYWRIQDLDDRLFLHLQGMQVKKPRKTKLKQLIEVIPGQKKKLFLAELPFQPKYCSCIF